ncbi:MAG: TssQ family T6SS-associated lipoprotein [Sulfuriferula sp.]
MAGMLLLIMSGCQSIQSSICDTATLRNTGTSTDKKLNYGVLSYEEGNYQASIMALQGVLETGLSGKPEQVKAYKYLAFIQCVSGREAMCRDYFKKALEIDPHFTLDAAEAGHPIWGPIFRSVKSKYSK